MEIKDQMGKTLMSATPGMLGRLEISKITTFLSTVGESRHLQQSSSWKQKSSNSDSSVSKRSASRCSETSHLLTEEPEVGVLFSFYHNNIRFYLFVGKMVWATAWTTSSKARRSNRAARQEEGLWWWTWSGRALTFHQVAISTWLFQSEFGDGMADDIWDGIFAEMTGESSTKETQKRKRQNSFASSFSDPMFR